MAADFEAVTEGRPQDQLEIKRNKTNKWSQSMLLKICHISRTLQAGTVINMTDRNVIDMFSSSNTAYHM